MTDYRYWEKLDVDQVLEEHDARLTKEEVQENRRRKVQQQAMEQTNSVSSAKKQAEALQSKVCQLCVDLLAHCLRIFLFSGLVIQSAVEALKAKGGMGGRRRGNTKAVSHWGLLYLDGA